MRWTPSCPSSCVAVMISCAGGDAGGMYSRPWYCSRSSTSAHGYERVLAQTSSRRAMSAGSCRCVSCSLLTKSKRGADSARIAPSSVSRLDKASATAFVAPGLYSTAKSNPSSFPTQ